MNLKKGLILGAVALGILVILGVTGIVPNPIATGTPVDDTGPEVTAYGSLEHHLAFVYPANYELKEFPLKNEADEWTAITLIDKEILKSAIENGASEGPPTIAIQIFPNPTNITAEEWIKGSRFSNYGFSTNTTFATTTIGGQPAFGYIYSGLYSTDVLVVSHNSKIYMFLADWIAEDDKNRQDFDPIIESVQFI
ncbi:MAG: hypothetical protein KBD50_01515 [Candidatus Pacebacteria bacterium]|nr:hypothetical protein [Candidatus Paceibacterota bacterium]